MNIGFLNIYAYRPHGHHAAFLASLLASRGHKTFSLDCMSVPDTCYVREYKGTGKFECAKCSLGGLHTFNFDRSEGFKRYWDSNASKFRDELVKSSAFTLTRIESFEQRTSEPVESLVKKLSPDANRFMLATKKWIIDNSIEAVILFNGRMDFTRAVLEACIECNVPCLTHERPLYGHGIILNRNRNCSSLINIHRINKKFGDKPLTSKQVKIAAKLAAQRLLGGNPLEWKVYNSDPDAVREWPVQSAEYKVLVCPSSKNELLGHPDWETPWRDNTDALDLSVKKGLFKYEDMLVRGHPSWAETFGVVSAEKCETHYRVWCESRGVHFIPSVSKANTKDLMKLADVVVLNGSNTVLEAGMMGKPVVCLGPSSYTHSGASIDVLVPEDLDSLAWDEVLRVDNDSVVRRTLRYFYSKAVREPLFVDQVRSRSVTECDFYSGADASLIEAFIQEEQELVSDDSFAESGSAEDSVVKAFLSGDVSLMAKYANFDWETSANQPCVINRRGIYKLIDKVRNLTPKGV